jgi:DNA polymerase/3'-5' exonuclease PolX
MVVKAAIPLAEATRIADAVVADLEPHCERVAVAGSLRRQTAKVGDLEIVAIPKVVPGGLWGTEVQNALWTHLHTSEAYRFLKGDRPDARMHQLNLAAHAEVQLDLFLAQSDNWGWIYLLRTGSADFSQRILTLWKKRHGLWREPGSVDGRLVTRGGHPVATPEEEPIFAMLGMPFVAPEQRHA